ncbi:uncharacterized ABC transporter permease protein YufQ [Acidimicrobiaceae bacterium]|nr:uncharacterized ABC transporter permease protein YufQ [Acidimicrobiaceae bacterium]
MPILLAGMAGLWAERCGVLNIGIEGMMIFGTWFGAWGAWQYGPWVGLLFAILGGMFGGLVHSVATVRFNIDQVISGVVINLFAFFGVRYLSELVYVGKPGGGISQSPPQKWALPRFNLPILSGGEIVGWKSPDFLGWLESQRWFILGDLGGIWPRFDAQYFLGNGDCNRRRAVVGMDFVAHSFWFALEVFG